MKNKPKKPFRFDIARWRFAELNLTYDVIAKKSKMSSSTVWALCSPKSDPGDPTVSTVKSLFIGLGLNPAYALNFQLKKSDFDLAVVRKEKAGSNGAVEMGDPPSLFF